MPREPAPLPFSPRLLCRASSWQHQGKATPTPRNFGTWKPGLLTLPTSHTSLQYEPYKTSWNLHLLGNHVHGVRASIQACPPLPQTPASQGGWLLLKKDRFVSKLFALQARSLATNRKRSTTFHRSGARQEVCIQDWPCWPPRWLVDEDIHTCTPEPWHDGARSPPGVVWLPCPSQSPVGPQDSQWRRAPWALTRAEPRGTHSLSSCTRVSTIQFDIPKDRRGGMTFWRF